MTWDRCYCSLFLFLWGLVRHWKLKMLSSRKVNRSQIFRCREIFVANSRSTRSECHSHATLFKDKSILCTCQLGIIELMNLLSGFQFACHPTFLCRLELLSEPVLTDANQSQPYRFRSKSFLLNIRPEAWNLSPRERLLSLHPTPPIFRKW